MMDIPASLRQSFSFTLEIQPSLRFSDSLHRHKNTLQYAAVDVSFDLRGLTISAGLNQRLGFVVLYDGGAAQRPPDRTTMQAGRRCVSFGEIERQPRDSKWADATTYRQTKKTDQQTNSPEEGERCEFVEHRVLLKVAI